MSYKILYITLRRLIGERAVPALRSQLLQHGPVLFARALALGSPRVVADALSLLPMGERITVLRHLPAPLRETMKPLCIGSSPRVRLQVGSVAACVLHHP
ncbi:hypothetical protein IAE57_01865 [Stenotrophomonas sp. S48]|uniref:hypothetical protein n=1 Tax=unclassified Stenotrophomonas TaxID=196198 RepID=UPI0019027E32|nr:MULTISPECIES: hypothetical protein [unclassified Stenotrophomonas]MBK0024897.1 hypothetical protein [Stenotrophomonas sp. S48]MBK0050391.1 hypothetical protein [Stenotrophomonas sp. S49]